MQNAECKIVVCPSGIDLNPIGEADTIILHFEFCILHFIL